MPIRLAVTLGDPGGIGPEIVEAALAAVLPGEPDVRVTVVGPLGIADVVAGRTSERADALVQSSFSGVKRLPSAESGAASLAAIDAAIGLARRGEADALVTAPISKAALAAAGSGARGHTEILERELGSGAAAMAFFSASLRIALATTHVPLRHAIEMLAVPQIVEKARLLRDALVEIEGIPAPRLALAGLNPHAGESGLIGDEEQRVLQPAVAHARAQGITLLGPLPADTVFRRALDGEVDGVVALYHDQGLIPVKMLGFGASVHLTLGLQVPRTSPDHGTAFELAGTGRAKPDGMIAALRMATRWCRARRQ
jgi:4-hydroxythreonine-4-phosphate dehydrogenase